MENLITFIEGPSPTKLLLAFCTLGGWAQNERRREGEGPSSTVKKTLDHAAKDGNVGESAGDGYQASVGELASTATTNKGLGTARRFNRGMLPSCFGRHIRAIRWTSWLYDFPVVVDQEPALATGPKASDPEAFCGNDSPGGRGLGWGSGRGTETMRLGGRTVVGIRKSITAVARSYESLVLSSIQTPSQKGSFSGISRGVSNPLPSDTTVLRRLPKLDAQWVCCG